MHTSKTIVVPIWMIANFLASICWAAEDPAAGAREILGKPIDWVLRYVGSPSSMFLAGSDALGLESVAEDANILLSYRSKKHENLIALDATSDVTISIETEAYAVVGISLLFGLDPTKPEALAVSGEDLIRVAGNEFLVIRRPEVSEDGGVLEVSVGRCHEPNGPIETWYFAQHQMEAMIVRDDDGVAKVISLFFADDLDATLAPCPVVEPPAAEEK